jgi:DNA-binding GntR family transcriptional regulator
MFRKMATIAPLRQTRPSVVEEPPKSLSDQAYERLLDMMLAGNLPAGTVLQERRLADSLKISRTPVREALGRLEFEGLVTRRFNRLPTVRQLSIDEFVDILNVRKVLEVEAGTLAAGRVDPQRVAAARNAIRALQESDHRTVARQWETNEMVHGLICETSGNHLLAEMACELRRRTHMFDMRRIPSRFRESQEEHLDILDAVSRGDVEGTRQALANHIDNVKRSIVDTLLGGR